MRLHLFEFMDLSWFPDSFRRIQTDYLRYVATRGAGHQHLVPLIGRALRETGTAEIVDLCSGGTGPWLNLQRQLAEAGYDVSVRLTDKYPHPEAVEHWQATSDSSIAYLTEPVDATRVPPHLHGMRTLFEGFHHFQPEQARSILRDAVEQRVAIGIFEISLKPPLGWLLFPLLPLMTVLAFWVLTPFIKPPTPARLLWTYVLPLVPLTTSWDGIVSFLRVYTPRALQELVSGIPCRDYTWDIGRAPTGTPVFEFVYLLGYPSAKT